MQFNVTDAREVLDRTPATVQEADGWTLRTADRSLASHYEHTLVITRGAPLVLTAA